MPLQQRKARLSKAVLMKTRLCGSVHFAALILQIRFPLSSETSSEPSRAVVTPTGRPHCSIGDSPEPSLARKPVRKSSIGPGLPSAIGKKTTLYPEATDRFHEPCSATKPPLRYRCGNCVPV